MGTGGIEGEDGEEGMKGEDGRRDGEEGMEGEDGEEGMVGEDGDDRRMEVVPQAYLDAASFASFSSARR